MKIAIVGSRSLKIESISEYIPIECDEIVTGGARGVDTYAAEYAERHGIPLTLFHPDYKRYGRGAPILRNREIIEHADCVVAIWDGKSRGTKNVIEECRKKGIEVKVFLINKEQ